jgi:ABC-type proline/glycine betaine transport system permease subunit
MDLRGLFPVYNSGVRMVENNIILTHLFNARKASLASGVRSFCSNINRIPVISVFAVRVTPIFTSKIHAINTLKMGALLRINVMLP